MNAPMSHVSTTFQRSICFSKPVAASASNGSSCDTAPSLKYPFFKSQLEQLVSNYGSKLCAFSLATLVYFTPSVQASLTDTLSSENAILDAARIIPSAKRQQTNDSLLEFEKDTGWRIRILTAYQGQSDITEDQIREVWRPDRRSVVLAFDPSSPNIVAVRYVGDEVQTKLKRQFWVELQSRFGNMFFVREQGEASAVFGIVDSIEECLRQPNGCAVVPGLPTNQYIATLIVSIAGGVVLGFSAKTGSQGSFIQRVTSIALFSPLWLILFVSLGLGPVVSRTADKLPIIENTAAFLGTALVLQLLEIPPAWMKKEN